jgi:hypothetical protein
MPVVPIDDLRRRRLMFSVVPLVAAAVAVSVFALALLLPRNQPVPPAASSSTTPTSIAPGTTAPSTPTTTIPPTTTVAPTTTLLAGNWADVPLVVYGGWGGIAMGWSDGSAWAEVEGDTALPLVGGEDYQVALLGATGTVMGGPPHNSGCEVTFPSPGVTFDESEALDTFIDDGEGGERFIEGVAISAPWPLQPRAVQQGEAHPDLEAIAITLLEERGFITDIVEIVQTLDVDLNGDGTIETLVVVEETELANDISNVYSLVFAVSPAWDGALVISESVIIAGQSGYPASFRVSAVADLSGDGLMEVVIHDSSWEASGVTAYELTDFVFEPRLSAGCGV